MTKTTCFDIITLQRNSTFEAFKYGAQCPISGKRNSNVAIATSLILGKDSEVLNWTASTCSKSVSSCACTIGLLWKLHVQTFRYIWVMEVLQWFPYSSLGCPRFDQETNQFRGPGAMSVVDSAALGDMTWWHNKKSTAPDYLRFVESYHLHPRYILLVKKAAQNVRAPCGCQHVRYWRFGSRPRQEPIPINDAAYQCSVWINTHCPILRYKIHQQKPSLLSRASLDPFATSRLCHSQSQRPQHMPHNLGKPKPQHNLEAACCRWRCWWNQFLDVSCSRTRFSNEVHVNSQ